MSLIPTEYSDPIFVYSLRNVFPRYGGPLVRVIRESDHIEGDVYPDDNGEVSYDSTIIVNPSETSALILGEFLNIDGYTDADGLGEVYEGRLSKIYDQSAGSFDVGVNIYDVSFLFVETNLPAYGGSTAIHKVNGVPAFFVTATQPMFKLAQVRGREVSYHFMTEGVGVTQYFGFMDYFNTYRIWGLHDIEAEITSATLFPAQQWDINAVYFDSELGDNSLSSSVYSSETFNNFDSVITTVEAKILDTATTQSAFPDNEVTFNVMSNNWYCDIVAFDGYDPIRRITIEQLYAQSATNTTAFARTSSLLINNENPNQSGFLAQFPNAAAAYSVRSLTGNTGTNGPKIVRVRRDSDNVEVDVYTDETGFITLDSPISAAPAITGGIDGGAGAELETIAETLGDFVNNPDYNNPDNLASPDTAKVVVWYDQSDTNYSLSNLPEGIEERGAPIRIRVVGGTYDNYEFDVYFDDNETISLSSYVADTYEITGSNAQVTANLSEGTLQTLVDSGMTEATVVVWYDQSGNSNDATQATTSRQPKIVASGSVIEENGEAALEFDGSSTFLRNVSITTSGAHTIFSVNKYISHAGENVLWDSDTSPQTIVYIASSGDWIVQYGGTWTTSTAASGTQDVTTFLIDGANSEFWEDGTTQSTGDPGANNISGLTVGATRTNDVPWNGPIQEFVLYNSDQSANRTGIEATINNYYDIYGTGNTGDNDKLLDTYTDAAAAYSLRKLRTAYSGPVNLSNRKDAKQQVSTNQPTLVSSGELVRENGKAAVQFNGSSTLLKTTSLIYTTNTLFASSVTAGNSGKSVILSQNSGGGGRSGVLEIDISRKAKYFFAGNINFSTEILSNAEALISNYSYDDDYYCAVNGGTANNDITDTAFTPSATGASIGANYNGVNYFSGRIKEIIVWNSNQSANRTDIESNINSAFQIYSAAFPSALDTVPEAKAAYSVRRLTKEYTGPIITVNNGGTIKDFYADFWGNLDKTALTDFANGDTLNIIKWWDQSGRGEHLLATGGSKPTIDPATLNITVDSTNVFDSSNVINDINALTAGDKNLVAVFGGDINDTIDLNTTAYTDLKEIIHYQ